MSANVDFTDERVNRIADATFDDEMGGGAVAEWWDMLASIDADLSVLPRRVKNAVNVLRTAQQSADIEWLKDAIAIALNNLDPPGGVS